MARAERNRLSRVYVQDQELTEMCARFTDPTMPSDFRGLGLRRTRSDGVLISSHGTRDDIENPKRREDERSSSKSDKGKRSDKEKSKKHRYSMPKGVPDIDALIEPNIERADWALRTLLRNPSSSHLITNEVVRRLANCLKTRNLIVIERLVRHISSIVSARIRQLVQLSEEDSDDDEFIKAPQLTRSWSKTSNS